MGWGAADSDPRGLAAEWSSFEEAIEAWHEGHGVIWERPGDGPDCERPWGPSTALRPYGVPP